MGNLIRSHITLIVGACLPLIFAAVTGTFALILKMQFDLGALTTAQINIAQTANERYNDVNHQLDKIQSYGQQQHTQIEANRRLIIQTQSKIDSNKQRMDTLDQRVHRLEQGRK